MLRAATPERLRLKYPLVGLGIASGGEIHRWRATGRNPEHRSNVTFDAFFHRDGGRFVPTELTRGPWNADAQHGGPPAALLGTVMEATERRDDSMIVRANL